MFAGHDRRDAFGAVSVDEGESWKVTNLSNSADKSSFEVSTPLQDPGSHAGLEFEVTDHWTISEVEYEDKKKGSVLNAIYGPRNVRPKLDSDQLVEHMRAFQPRRNRFFDHTK